MPDCGFSEIGFVLGIIVGKYKMDIFQPDIIIRLSPVEYWVWLNPKDR